MSLLRLQNIGKIYVSEGSVAVGIRGVNLSFDRGEFVAVTGKSGSGKSTLLNVLSGMDTYEEGEMYIEENPTSHYLQSDFEEYRKKYISFIFQDYNIIESFTVLQNVELALMSIEDAKARRARALELIGRVGLSSHIHHKGSKLSGGQKQRTVIARALAKDSPIILADEPTGNLDSKSSAEIIELLYEISREKLVIVVTHSFDELEHYATRHIRIFDGAVERDEMISSERIIPLETVEIDREALKYKRDAHMRPKSEDKHTLKNGLTLGRVRFTARPKLSLFLCVLMTLTSLVITLVASLCSDALGLFDKTYIFEHVDGRVVVTKESGGAVSEDDLRALMEKTGANSYVHYDLMLDESVYMSIDDYYGFFNLGYPASSVVPNEGRLPETVGEVLMEVPISFKETFGDVFEEKEVFLFGHAIYNVTGVKYYYDNTRTPRLLFTDEGYKAAACIAYMEYNSHLFSLNINMSSENASDGFTDSFPVFAYDLVIDFTLPERTVTCQDNGYLKLVENYTGNFPDGFKQYVSFSGEYTSYDYDIYYGGGIMIAPDISFGPSYGEQSSLSLEFHDVTIKESHSDKIKEHERDIGKMQSAVCISPDILLDFFTEKYFAESYTQGSLFYGSDAEAESMTDKLRELGYIAVPSSAERERSIEETIEAVFILAVVAFTFVISAVFAVVFLMLCSGKAMGATKGDVGILRSMGIPTRVVRFSIYVQTFISLIPAYILTAVAAYVIFTTPRTNAMFDFIPPMGYVFIALSLLLVAFRLSRKYVREMFGESVKKTLRGGKRAE